MKTKTVVDVISKALEDYHPVGYFDEFQQEEYRKTHPIKLENAIKMIMEYFDLQFEGRAGIIVHKKVKR